MEYKEVLFELLRIQLNKSDAEVAELISNSDGTLKDDALELLKTQDAERVKSLKELATSRFDDGYKKAQKEVLDNLEKQIKEKTGSASDKKGLDLIEDVINEKVSAASKADGISDDKVKRHALYLDLEKKLKTEVDSKEKEWKEKFDKRESEIKRSETNQKVASEINKIVDELRPVFSTDATRAAQQRKDIAEAILKTNFEEVNGEYLPLKEDGSGRMEDSHGHAVKLKSLVSDFVTSRYDLSKAEERSSAGNQNKATESAYKGAMPKTEAEYVKLITDDKIPVEERSAIQEAWKKQNQE